MSRWNYGVINTKITISTLCFVLRAEFFDTINNVQHSQVTFGISAQLDGALSFLFGQYICDLFVCYIGLVHN